MSILGSMYTGVSGLNANSKSMAVIGNNVANINTPGFKLGRAEFSDVLTKSMAGGLNTGSGTKIDAVSTLHFQGGFQSTSSVTDLALEGDGFFMVRDGHSNNTYYTRAGNFNIDDNGYLVNAQGFNVQGFALDDNLKYQGTPQDIAINTHLLPPKATTEMSFHMNLSSNETSIPAGFDVADIENTHNYSTSITVYDSLGNEHQVTAYFTQLNQTATGSQWQYNVVVDGSDWAGGTPGVGNIAASGELTFDNQGRLDTETVLTSDFNFNGGAAANQAITIDFGSSMTTDGGTGLDGSTQFGDDNATLFQTQNGYSPAYLESIGVNEDGIVYGKYGNGEIQYYAQVAISNFSNPGGLDSIGTNLYTRSMKAGEPVVSVANIAGNGRIFSNSLEQSNVDLAEQFVNMIVTQRGFQANSKSITTSSEMMQDLVNLVR